MTDDPDANRAFTKAEADAYNPRPCPECGQRTAYYPFQKDVRLGGVEPTYTRGMARCTNPNCRIAAP